MPIAFECPKCRKEQRAQDHLVNRELKCAKCGGLFKVPAVGTGTPPARFVPDLYNGPKKAPPPAAHAPTAVPLPATPPAAQPLPAAAAFEQELILTDDMIVEASTKPDAAAPEPVMDLTEDMIVEETPSANAAATPEDLALLDEIIMEETAPPPSAKPPKKK
jgi:hypothetical protein